MGTIKKPSVKPVCYWMKTMATDLSRSDGQRISKVLFI
jgi:hypothetical protein